MSLTAPLKETHLFTPRVTRVFYDSGITTLGEVLSCPLYVLKSLPDAGKAFIEEVLAVLDENNLALPRTIKLSNTRSKITELKYRYRYADGTEGEWQVAPENVLGIDIETTHTEIIR